MPKKEWIKTTPSINIPFFSKVETNKDAKYTFISCIAYEGTKNKKNSDYFVNYSTKKKTFQLT